MAKRTKQVRNTTLSISMPVSLRAGAERKMRDGGFGNVSEYFRSLLRDDMRRQTALEQLVQEGLNSPLEPLDAKWLAERKRKLRDLVGTRRRRAG